MEIELIQVILLLAAFGVYVTATRKWPKDMISLGQIGTGLLVFAVVVHYGGFADVNEMFAPAVAPAPAPPPEEIPVGAKTLTITNLDVAMKEAQSNSYSAVAGTLEIYDAETDPSSPTADAITTVTISAGQGNDTSGLIKTNTNYRVVFDGAATHYDVDFGVMYFSSDDLNENTGQLTWLVTDIDAVATISDISDESDTTYNVSELIGSAGSWTYDESDGDGNFVFPLVIECAGANELCKDLSVCIDWDITNSPEGNEVSSLTTQLLTGANLGLPSDMLSYWSSESCYNLGDVLGGTKATYEVTVAVSEANLDTNDDWNIRVDDLGTWKGKDVALGLKATFQSEAFDAQA